MKTSNLILWVYEFGGPTSLANALGLCRQTVYQWMKGTNVMPIDYAVKILELSEGKLELKDLLPPSEIIKHINVSRKENKKGGAKC